MMCSVRTGLKNYCAPLIGILALFSSCDLSSPDPSPIISFEQQTLSCIFGAGPCLQTGESSRPTGGAIAYSIDNPLVATIDPATGTINPVSLGTATVTATQAEMPGQNLKATGTFVLNIITPPVKELYEFESRGYFSVGDLDNPFLIDLTLAGATAAEIKATIGGDDFVETGLTTNPLTGRIYVGFTSGSIPFDTWKDFPDGDPVMLTVTLTNSFGTFTISPFSLAKSSPEMLYTWRDIKNMVLDMEGSYTLNNNIKFPDPGTQQLPVEGFQGVTELIDQPEFNGTLDGDGHKITNLLGPYGLFYTLSDLATVKNLRIETGIQLLHGSIKPAGSVAFYNYGVIFNCSVLAEVYDTWTEAGAFVGKNYGTIHDCYVTGHLSSPTEMAGGFVGINSGTIYNCHANVDVSAHTIVGGFAAVNEGGTIENCFSRGKVSGVGKVGGLVGENRPNSYLSKSYFVGPVLASPTRGGVTGNSFDVADIGSCYFDKDIVDAPNFAIGAAVDGNTGDIYSVADGVASFDMKNPATFVGWDFTNVWIIDQTNDGYPHLR